MKIRNNFELSDRENSKWDVAKTVIIEKRIAFNSGN